MISLFVLKLTGHNMRIESLSKRKLTCHFALQKHCLTWQLRFLVVGCHGPRNSNAGCLALRQATDQRFGYRSRGILTDNDSTCLEEELICGKGGKGRCRQWRFSIKLQIIYHPSHESSARFNSVFFFYSSYYLLLCLRRRDFWCHASHSCLLVIMAYDLSVAEARNPLIAITVFAIIAIVFTGLRLQSRRVRRVPLASDDYLMVAALVRVVLAIFCSNN